MNPKRRIAYKTLVFALLAAVLVATGMWLQRLSTRQAESRGAGDSPKPSQVERQEIKEPQKPVTARELPVAETQRATLPPLPDHALPLAAQLPVLLQRAEAGDPVSSCRLIVGINRCKEQRRNQLYTERMIRDLQEKSRKNEGALIDLAAQMQERGEGPGQFCAAADTQSLPTPEVLLERAKDRLSPRQKAVMVLMRSDGSLRRLRGRMSFTESGLYVIPQFIADNSLQFLMQGYAAKDPLALEGLVLMHAPASAIAPSSVAVWLPNPELFLQYSMLMHELFGPESLGRSGVELAQVVAASEPPEEIHRLREVVRIEAEQWRRLGATQKPAPDPSKSSDPSDFSQCDE